ncbi:MAG: hypothetical protein IKR19_08005 [Acholeplasmatales bacterium]|nr:hypothetical protein [Acholeplasmatales bacterium]
MEILTTEMLEIELENAPVIGTKEGSAEYADYIQRGFLSSFLHEDNEEIVENLAQLQLKNSITESEVCDALANISVSNIGSCAKLEAMQKVIDIYAESVHLDELNESSTLLEYAGNPEKNKILIRLMKEMESRLEEYYEEVIFCVDALDQMAATISKEAKKGDKCNAKTAAYAVEGIYKKVDSKLTSKDYKEYVKKYNTTFSALKKICNSFGVKFNDVVMEDKKAFDNKLAAAVKKVKNNNKVTRWIPTEQGTTQIIKDLNKDLDTLGIDNKDAVQNIVKNFQPVYNYTYYAIYGYMGNINYIRKVLGLEKENTIFYKIINKLFKTKKD